MVTLVQSFLCTAYSKAIATSLQPTCYGLRYPARSPRVGPLQSCGVTKIPWYNVAHIKKGWPMRTLAVGALLTSLVCAVASHAVERRDSCADYLTVPCDNKKYLDCSNELFKELGTGIMLIAAYCACDSLQDPSGYKTVPGCNVDGKPLSKSELINSIRNFPKGVKTPSK